MLFVCMCCVYVFVFGQDVQLVCMSMLTFILKIGGLGECVQVGYSLIDQEKQGNIIFFYSFLFISHRLSYPFLTDVPTASLTFYSLNCDTGKWFFNFTSIKHFLLLLKPTLLCNNNNHKMIKYHFSLNVGKESLSLSQTPTFSFLFHTKMMIIMINVKRYTHTLSYFYTILSHFSFFF